MSERAPMRDPVLVLDLETTGLNKQKSQVLQIGAILYNPQTQGRFTLNFYVDNGPITYGEPFALQMNQKILKHIAVPKESPLPVYNIETAKMMFSQFTERCAQETNAGKPLVVAGKNVAGFDLTILDNQGFDLSKISHRTLDIGGMFYKQFGYVPSISQINKLLGRPPVSHDALEDCEDVLAAILYEMALLK